MLSGWNYRIIEIGGRRTESRENYRRSPVNYVQHCAPATTGQIMGAMSKYNNVPYLEDTGGNNTIYKFWQETLIGTFSYLHSYEIDKIKYVLKGGQLVVALQSDEPLGIYDGQVYNYTGDNWPNVGSATPGPISVERLGAIGSADQDWFYPLEYLTPSNLFETKGSYC